MTILNVQVYFMKVTIIMQANFVLFFYNVRMFNHFFLQIILHSLHYIHYICFNMYLFIFYVHVQVHYILNVFVSYRGSGTFIQTFIRGIIG